MTSEVVNVAELLREAQSDQLDEVVARDLTRALAYDGLRCSPCLFAILAERGVPGPSRDYDAPAIVADFERLDGVAVKITRSRGSAMAGAGLLVLVAASIGWYRWHPYGVAALVAGLAAAAAVGPGFSILDRRLPSWAPRGALLGATVTAACGLVCFAVFVALRRVSGA